MKQESVKKHAKTINYNPNDYMGLAGLKIDAFRGMKKSNVLKYIDEFENLSDKNLRIELKKWQN